MLIDDFFTLKIETMLPFSKSDHSILQGTLAQPWSQFAALPLASPMACVHNSIIEGIFKITLLLVKIISFYIFIWISWILFLCMAPFFLLQRAPISQLTINCIWYFTCFIFPSDLNKITNSCHDHPPPRFPWRSPQRPGCRLCNSHDLTLVWKVKWFDPGVKSINFLSAGFFIAHLHRHNLGLCKMLCYSDFHPDLCRNVYRAWFKGYFVSMVARS